MIKILAIDEEIENINALRSVVANAFPDAEVISVEDGLTGITIAESFDPDTIVVNSEIKEITAFEFCDLLINNISIMDIPIVMSHSKDLEEQKIIEGLTQGIDACLPIPFELSRVYAIFSAMQKVKQANRITRIEKEKKEAAKVNSESSSEVYRYEVVKLLEKNKYYNSRLKLFTNVIKQVIGTEPIDISAKNMLMEIANAFECDAGIIRVLKNEGLELLTKYNVPDESIVPVIPANFGIAGIMFQNREPYFIPNTFKDSNTSNIIHFHKNAFQFISYVGAPLLVQDKVIGVLGIYSTKKERHFVDEDLSHLQIAANHVAAALENENLYLQLIERKNELENEVKIRIETEMVLREKEEHLQMIVNKTKAAFYRLDYSTMKFIYLHPVIENLIGYTPDEIFKIGLSNLVLKVDKTGSGEVSLTHLKELRGKVTEQFKADYLIRRKDGSEVWISDNSNPWFDENGNLVGSIGVLIDVSDRKEAELKAQKNKEKAEELMHIKSSFFANMSHELRTPLVGIIGFSEVLQMELSDRKELSKAFEYINVSAKRLHETFDLILNVSRLEAGKVDLRMTECNIIPIVKSQIDLQLYSAEKKGLKIESIFESDSLFCYVDVFHFSTIIENLINNAIKFTKVGKITVTAELFRSKVVISIKDTGVGIPLDKQYIIWEEFRQASEGLNRSFEGTGLGLTIAKKYTELMGGSISVISKVGEGSEFIVEFPASLLKEELVIDNDFLGEEMTENINELKNEKYTILYVEDDQISAQVVTYMIANLYDIDIAKSAEEAIELTSKKQYKAILMDVNLKKGMDGVQLTQFLREKPYYDKVPIIALTAYAATKDRDEFLAKGMNYYISKPFRKVELLEVLTKACKQ